MWSVVRCVWQTETGAGNPSQKAEGEASLTSPFIKVLPRVRLPADVVAKLRELSQLHPPQIRPSIRYRVPTDPRMFLNVLEFEYYISVPLNVLELMAVFLNVLELMAVFLNVLELTAVFLNVLD